MSNLLNGLNFIVQYRRKDQTHSFDPWHAMAAFDVQGPAEKYYAQQESRVWEYRLIEIETGAALSQHNRAGQE